MLPPLFDDVTDEDLAKMSAEVGILVAQINLLRDKELHGGGITNDEVKEGIRLLNEVRQARAGKASTIDSRIPLEKLF